MFLTNRVPDGVVDGKNPWLNRRSRRRGRNSRAGGPRRGWHVIRKVVVLRWEVEAPCHGGRGWVGSCRKGQRPDIRKMNYQNSPISTVDISKFELIVLEGGRPERRRKRLPRGSSMTGWWSSITNLTELN